MVMIARRGRPEDGTPVLALSSAVGGLPPGVGCKSANGVDWAFTLVQSVLTG